MIVYPSDMTFPIMDNSGVPPPPQGMLRVKLLKGIHLTGGTDLFSKVCSAALTRCYPTSAVYSVWCAVRCICYHSLYKTESSMRNREIQTSCARYDSWHMYRTMRYEWCPALSAQALPGLQGDACCLSLYSYGCPGPCQAIWLIGCLVERKLEASLLLMHSQLLDFQSVRSSQLPCLAADAEVECALGWCTCCTFMLHAAIKTSA